MRSVLVFVFFIFGQSIVFSQGHRTDLYDLVKKLINDSTGYENVGNWAISKPRTYPVAWRANRIEMSKDTSINFFRSGTTDITIRNKSLNTGKWKIMLKGARSGYTSFSIISPPSKNLHPVIIPDSIFGNKPFKVQLLKTCKKNRASGFNYYKLKIPKKDEAYLKVSWVTAHGNTTLRIDGYDSRSKYAVKLRCP